MIRLHKEYLAMKQDTFNPRIFQENVKSALESANEVREHDMRRISHNNSRAIYQCCKCSMQLEVIAKPLPNETFISGEAVALVCLGEE
jgi:predicted SprT family Zn-dependent metalloprotease